MQDKSAEKSSHAERLDRLRIATQSTWAEVAGDIGLSESMIYQVKKGTRQLSPKAEYRLAVIERKEGLAPPIERSVNSATSGDEAIAAFVKASSSEQLQILEREPGLRRLWFEMQLMGVEKAIMTEVHQAMKLAGVAKSVAKSPDDPKLRTQMLKLSKSVSTGGKNLESLLPETFDSIRNIVSNPGL